MEELEGEFLYEIPGNGCKVYKITSPDFEYRIRRGSAEHYCSPTNTYEWDDAWRMVYDKHLISKGWMSEAAPVLQPWRCKSEA